MHHGALVWPGGPAGRLRLAARWEPTAWRERVTNRQSVPLEDAILAFGKQVYLLGTLAPGATVRVELASDRNLSGHLKAKTAKYMSEQPWNRDDFQIDRSDLMLAVMFHDSETTTANERGARQRPAPRPRPVRATRLAAADARGPDQPHRRPARPGKRAVAAQDRSVDVGPHHPAAQANRRRTSR